MKQRGTLESPGTHRNEDNSVFPDRKQNPRHSYEMPLDVLCVTRQNQFLRKVGLEEEASQKHFHSKENYETPVDGGYYCIAIQFDESIIFRFNELECNGWFGLATM